VAKAAKKAIRGLRDSYQKMVHEAATSMSEEEIRMANRCVHLAAVHGAGSNCRFQLLIIAQTARKEQDWCGPRRRAKEAPYYVRYVSRGLTVIVALSDNDAGLDEGNSFQAQNHFFQEKVTVKMFQNPMRRADIVFCFQGMPYFVQNSKGFGFQLYIWTQNTMKIQEFITHVQLSHKDPTHPKFKGDTLLEDGYEKVEHEKSNIIFWIKRDPKKVRHCRHQIVMVAFVISLLVDCDSWLQSRSIAEIAFSFDSADDVRCFADGFERLNEEESLEDYGFPPSTVWVRKIDKLKHEERLNVDALATEFNNGIVHYPYVLP
jgi:hypothetical protein